MIEVPAVGRLQMMKDPQGAAFYIYELRAFVTLCEPPRACVACWRSMPLDPTIGVRGAPSAALLAIARERLPAADVREGDLEALPFPDAGFDAVTAVNSIFSENVFLWFVGGRP